MYAVRFNICGFVFVGCGKSKIKPAARIEDIDKIAYFLIGHFNIGTVRIAEILIGKARQLDLAVLAEGKLMLVYLVLLRVELIGNAA